MRRSKMKSRKNQTGIRATTRKSAAPKGVREKRRLIQLIVSLLLFLAVFAGRKMYSDQLKSCAKLICWDMNLREAIRVFEEVGEEGSVGQALQKLGFGTVAATEPPQEMEPAIEVVPLIQTGRFGLSQAREYGITTVMPLKVETELPAEPEVVTAVAQMYGEDGTKLPSNVSFAYYELGLPQTVVPVSGEITSNFGYRTSPVNGKQEFHLAIDIAAAKGTPILAFAEGVVRYIGESDEFGLYLMLDHSNGASTFYAHCSKLLVKKGETVSCGQTIALVGDTGNAIGSHLHWSVLKDEIRLNPAFYVDW